MSAVLQWLVVAVMVGWSLHMAFRRLLPAASRALQAQLGEVCMAHGWPRLAHLLHATAPVVPGCGSGCSGCDTSLGQTPCSKTPAAAEQAVQWRSPPSSGACH